MYTYMYMEVGYGSFLFVVHAEGSSVMEALGEHREDSGVVHTSCALGDCLTSRPEGQSRPRELWFSIYSCVHVIRPHLHIDH